jgi:hypothetical protein
MRHDKCFETNYQTTSFQHKYQKVTFWNCVTTNNVLQTLNMQAAFIWILTAQNPHSNLSSLSSSSQRWGQKFSRLQNKIMYSDPKCARLGDNVEQSSSDLNLIIAPASHTQFWWCVLLEKYCWSSKFWYALVHLLTHDSTGEPHVPPHSYNL